MPRRQGPMYPEGLSTPFKRFPDKTHPAERSVVEVAAERTDEFARRLHLLMKFHKVAYDPDYGDHWYDLACSLAIQHVPGFTVEQRGAETVWRYPRCHRLYLAVREYLERNPALSIEAACNWLAKNDQEWKDERKGPTRQYAQTLAKRYRRIRTFADKVEAFREEEAKAGKRPIRVLEHEPMQVCYPASAAAANRIIEQLVNEDKEQERRRFSKLLSGHSSDGQGQAGQ